MLAAACAPRPVLPLFPGSQACASCARLLVRLHGTPEGWVLATRPQKHACPGREGSVEVKEGWDAIRQEMTRV